MKKWLSGEEWQKYLDTYCGTDVNEMWSAVESMCRLFYDASKWVAGLFEKFLHPEKESVWAKLSYFKSTIPRKVR